MGITVTPSLAGYREKFGAACIPIMPYKKTFSLVKMAVNKMVLALKRN